MCLIVSKSETRKVKRQLKAKGSIEAFKILFFEHLHGVVRSWTYDDYVWKPGLNRASCPISKRWVSHPHYINEGAIHTYRTREFIQNTVLCLDKRGTCTLGMVSVRISREDFLYAGHDHLTAKAVYLDPADFHKFIAERKEINEIQKAELRSIFMGRQGQL